jgi:predicted metal-dependent hydrolase
MSRVIHRHRRARPAGALFAIVHELLHVQVPNHDKLWKSLMRLYLGDYEKKESRLCAIVTPQIGAIRSRLSANQRKK